MQGLALTTEQILEILSAYTAPQVDVPAVVATPGWYVVGAFLMPASSGVRMAAVGAVSAAGLTLRVRLFDLTMALPVEGALLQFTSMLPARGTSGSFTLTGGRVYQFQAETTGATGDDRFGSLESANLTNE